MLKDFEQTDAYLDPKRIATRRRTWERPDTPGPDQPGAENLPPRPGRTATDQARLAGDGLALVLRRDGMPDLPARIAAGTFLIAGPDLADLPERGPAAAVLMARDHAGNVREELLYQE
ncbi:hypothetical protein [Actinacidiphila oryziradicis]|uniref:hypothetical protein n=1 Tax=Actinacidiphila oryziradicis TaxID=2571141 RepID=UPI00145F5F3F|nr:hypothetical protein [Actinacidiphila oryziradicis]